MATPPASLLYRVTGFVVYLFAGVTMGLVIVSAVLSLLDFVDWSVLGGPLAELVLVVAFLYWTTTLLPGPVKKVAKVAGRQVMKSASRKKRE